MPKYKISFTDVIQDSPYDMKKVLEKKARMNFPNAKNLKVIKLSEKRTIPQNKALHLYLTLLAERLNDAGFTQKTILNKVCHDISLPVTETSLKDIFRSIATAMFDVKSTADLTTKQIQAVYEAFDYEFSRNTGISIEWPSEDELLRWANDNI